jgi:translation initiation factor IF-1
MANREAIEVEGTIVGLLPNKLFRVELPNGHKLMGHPARNICEDLSLYLPGTKVLLSISPYDLSKGKITDRQSENSVALAGR